MPENWVMRSHRITTDIAVWSATLDFLIVVFEMVFLTVAILEIFNVFHCKNMSRDRKQGHVTSWGITNNCIWSANINFLLPIFWILFLSVTVLEIFNVFCSEKYVTWSKTGSRDRVGPKLSCALDRRHLTSYYPYLKFCFYLKPFSR